MLEKDSLNELIKKLFNNQRVLPFISKKKSPISTDKNIEIIELDGVITIRV